MLILLKAAPLPDSVAAMMWWSICRWNWQLFQEQANGTGRLSRPVHQPGKPPGENGWLSAGGWRQVISQSFTGGRIMGRKEIENARGSEDTFLWPEEKIKKIDMKVALKKTGRFWGNRWWAACRLSREKRMAVERRADGKGTEQRVTLKAGN